MKKLLLFSLIFTAIGSCKKAPDRSCFKSTGETGSKRIEMKDFTALKLKKNLNYVFVQDDSCYLVLSGGKNLLNLITFNELEDGTIQIQNENKCNFLRKLGEAPSVEIHFKNLTDLTYEGSLSLTNKDTLHLNDFNFVILDACGSLNLNLSANIVWANVAYGWGDYTLSGSCKVAYIDIRSNGYCDVRNLHVLQDMEITNESQGHMYINADKVNLSGYISGSGNVYYLGTPLTNDVNVYGEGKLIQQ